MKNKLGFLISSLFLCFATNTYSSPITEINFIGLNNSSEDNLLKEIPFKIGQEYSVSSSNEIIQSLFETGLFSNISITESNNKL